MTTRAEYLDWCKDHAIEFLAIGGPALAVVSLINDLGKWQGGSLYDEPTLRGMIDIGKNAARLGPVTVRAWINGLI